jgi:hypothetical protein
VLPQLLSLHDRRNCYTATEETPCSSGTKQSSSSRPHHLVFTMRKSSAAAHMAAATTGLSCKHYALAPSFQTRSKASFSRRNCKVRGSDGKEAARISGKSARGVASRPVTTTLGDDVFSLVVRPGVSVGAATIMAMVTGSVAARTRPWFVRHSSSTSYGDLVSVKRGSAAAMSTPMSEKILVFCLSCELIYSTFQHII